MTRHRTLATLVLGVALVAGCTGEPILANPPPPRPTVAPEPVATPAPADPVPVVLPRDDGAHERLTEWWYYTGHLRDEAGGRWGFEYVIFRAERGSFPVSWASHLALTDETGGRFHYGQRSEIGPQVDRTRTPDPAASSPRPDRPILDLAISGLDPADPATLTRSPWTMTGGGGRDRLAGVVEPAEAAGDPLDGPFGLDLDLVEAKAPVLHDGDGWVDFGPAGGSYYYSRTRMDATGTLIAGERTLPVTGDAWFDHQWGDFIAVGGGGWDWFAVNLADGTDVTLSLVRALDGTYPLVYGTLVEADGRVRHLDRDAFSVEVTGTWTSPRTGARYPAGWRVELPTDELLIELRPTVADQELDTRATTGVVYWEGSQVVTASRAGVPLAGEAYVELTGYPPAD